MHLTSPVQSRVRGQLPSNSSGVIGAGSGYPSFPASSNSASYHPSTSVLKSNLTSPTHPHSRPHQHPHPHPVSHILSPPPVPTHQTNGSNRSYSYAQGGSGSTHHPSTSNPITHTVGPTGTQTSSGQPPGFMQGTGNDQFPYPFSLSSFASEGEPSTSSSSVGLSGSGPSNGQINGQASTSSGRIQGYTGGSVAGYGPGPTLVAQEVNGIPDGLPLNGAGSTKGTAVPTGQSSVDIPGLPAQPPSTSNATAPASSSAPPVTTTTNPDPAGKKRRKQHVSRGGSVASLASATSTGSRGSGGVAENVPRVGGVR
jgi:hypothetical protein